MEQEPKKRTGRKLLAGIGIGVLAVLGIVAAASGAPASPAAINTQIAPQQQQPVVQSAQQEAASQTSLPSATLKTVTSSPAPSSGLSNDNYYTNVSGNTVHSPAYSNDNSVPAGATARCGDGTYSFSQHHGGTCSHHGGVASWL